jgi:hypothetical protein
MATISIIEATLALDDAMTMELISPTIPVVFQTDQL